MYNKFIIFSDFDGTITNTDILDNIIVNLYSYEKYKEVENELLMDKLKYEDYLYLMFNNIKYDLSNISKKLVDDTFLNFYNWIINNNIEFYIISSGFKSIIEYMLPYVDKNNIYGNDININENNEWKIKLYDEQNNCSINKNHIIKKHYDINKKTIFIGDGLSDFKVIGNVDYLFCKRNSLLHNKCINENYDYIIFDNFTDVLTKIKKLNNN